MATRSGLERLGIAMAVSLGVCLAAAGGIVIWALGYHVWFWVWITVSAYIAVGGVVSARQAPRNPWEHWTGGFLTPPWKVREATRKKWDADHLPDR